MSGLREGESGIEFFDRKVKEFASYVDPGGTMAFTKAASVAAIALADRNEPVQRQMRDTMVQLLAELRSLNQRLDRLLPPTV